ncbi:hypothetical protein TNCT_402491 [Trichonephila clavata]|uniref:Uncharacterized protein n=1 Tax=Trichonephila clavata TaxID=2740835 RepID=A0A8X6FBV5_TRICU|nr:hypothetical protein TNCT_402491 [Trichonephila clavata]
MSKTRIDLTSSQELKFFYRQMSSVLFCYTRDDISSLESLTKMFIPKVKALTGERSTILVGTHFDRRAALLHSSAVSYEK